MQSEKQNYYQVLDLSPNVSQSEIDTAYSRAIRTYSDDSAALYSLMGSDESLRMREQIEEAYSILGSPHKRQEYDRLRGFNTDQNENIYKRSANSQQDIAQFESSIALKKGIQVDRDWAIRKFELDYDIDQEMEDFIEQNQEFTGQTLQKIREYKNVSLERLAEMSKILKTYLIYIENNAFDKLPATVYARGFVYQYAKCLKLNTDLVTRSYIDRLKRHRGEAIAQASL